MLSALHLLRVRRVLQNHGVPGPKAAGAAGPGAAPNQVSYGYISKLNTSCHDSAYQGQAF